MKRQRATQASNPDYYQCPGERSKLTRAMCLARQGHNYEKCAQCPHRAPPRPKAKRMRRLRI